MALDKAAATLALRNRALSVSVAATGTTSLAATSTGYTRAAGSFLDDGFAVGMEVLAAGFATAGNNGYKVITAVSALSMTVQSPTTMSTESAGGNESILCKLPEGKAFENIAFAPVAGRPYVEEDFVPATKTLTGLKHGGLVQETGLYMLKYYGLADKGVTAIRRMMDALEALYAPGTTLTASGLTVRVRTDLASWQGQILPVGDGRAVVTLTVPWEAWSINSIAA